MLAAPTLLIMSNADTVVVTPVILASKVLYR
jgi:hypothetical protein